LFFKPLNFSDLSPEYGRFIVLVSVFNLLLNAVVGIVLTWKPQLVADRLPPSRRREAEIRTNASSLILVGFAVAGVVFVVLGLRGLVYQAVVWLSAPKGPYFQTNVDRAAVAAGIFETLMGFWLLCGFKGIFRGLRRVWLAGRTLGATQSETDSEQ
jgi:hypothetical protein